MKTFNALDLLAKSLGRYPEGSVTPRTVIMNLSVGTNPEESFQSANQFLTKFIFDKAKETPPRAKPMTPQEVDVLTLDLINQFNTTLYPGTKT